MVKDLITRANQARKNIWTKAEHRELLLDSALAFFIRLGSAVAVFFMNVVVARYLGINASGFFFLSLSIITIVATVVRIGADNVVLRFVGIHAPEKNWTKVRGIVYKVIIMVFIISILVTAGIMVFSKEISVSIFKKIELQPPLFWISIAIPCIALSTVIAMGLQGIKKVLYSVSIQNVFTPFILMAMIFILVPKSSGEMSFLYFIASFCTLAISVFLWFRFVPKGDYEFDRKVIITNCMPLWTVAVLQQAIQLGGQFIAGIYCGPKVLAQLAVAQRTSMLISFILIAINLVSAPRFAMLYNEKRMAELKKYAINTTRVMIFFATPILIFVYFFTGFILSVFGKGFVEAAWMLRILATGQYVNVISGSVGYLLLMSGHNKEFRNIIVISGILSIILNFVLIRLYNGIGAAVAIALAVAFSNLLAVGMVKKRLGFNTMAVWFK